MRNLILILVFFPFTFVSAQVYKWVDENGVHFSDKPQPGAETLKLPKSTQGKKKAKSNSGEESEGSDVIEGEGYKSLTITSPTDGGTVRNDEGKVKVSVSLSPTLISGDKYRYTLDGQSLPEAIDFPNVEFSNVNRGEHSLQVSVVDSSGKTRIQSKTIKFHLRQQSNL